MLQVTNFMHKELQFSILITMIRCTNFIFSACPLGYLQKPARKIVKGGSTLVVKSKISGCKESCDPDNDCVSFEYNPYTYQCLLHSKTKSRYKNRYVFPKKHHRQLCIKGNIFCGRLFMRTLL